MAVVQTQLSVDEAMKRIRSMLPELAQVVADDMADGIELNAENLDGEELYVPYRLLGGAPDPHGGPFTQAPLSGASVVFSQRGTGGPGVDTGAMVAMFRGLGATAKQTGDSITMDTASVAGKLLVKVDSDTRKDPVDYFRIYEAVYAGGPIFGVSSQAVAKITDRLDEALAGK